MNPMSARARAIRFGVVGGGSTAIHIIVAGVGITWGSLPIWFANAMAFTVATGFSLVANTWWSFGTQLNSARNSRFFAVTLLGLILTVAISGSLDARGFSPALAIAAVVVFVPPISFSLHHLWTFRD